MIRRIDHVAIAVRDQAKAKAFFVDILGGRELFCAPMPGQGYRWTTIELGSSCFIELIDPTDTEGFAHRFLASRGEGPHHITVMVDDIRKVHEHLTAKGVPTFGYSDVLPNWKEFFVHPKHAFGTLIQVVEFAPLEWINPGYVPPSYWEFTPPVDVGDVHVQRVKAEGGPMIELRQGDSVIRLPAAAVPALITALRDQSSAGE